eukprot:6228107-Amphidinium_carterae.1
MPTWVWSGNHSELLALRSWDSGKCCATRLSSSALVPRIQHLCPAAGSEPEALQTLGTDGRPHAIEPPKSVPERVCCRSSPQLPLSRGGVGFVACHHLYRNAIFCVYGGHGAVTASCEAELARTIC